jgi:alpha-1,2-mannosyltransferase
MTRLPPVVLILGSNTLILVSLIGTSAYLERRGVLPAYAKEKLVSSLASFATYRQISDSWEPMLEAVNHLDSGSKDTVYEELFFRRKVKFQYPLTSLLPVWAILHVLNRTLWVLRILKLLSWLAVLVYVCCVTALPTLQWPPVKKNGPSRFLVCALIGLAALTFYPMMRAFELGQLQTIINAVFAVVFLCYLKGREKAAGLLIGCLVLLKPQYFLMVLWGILRKKYTFVRAALICLIAGFGISVALFGLSNNLDYLRVLSFISKHGESFYANQSVNGLLNRMLMNGDNVEWAGNSFPSYSPLVYAGSLIAAVLLILWSVVLGHHAPGKGNVADFALVAIACTIASPEAWEHHYGVMLPIFVWILTSNLRLEARSWFLLFVSYVLIADDWSITNLTAAHPLFNILQSYMIFGALLLMLVLQRLLWRSPQAGSAAKISGSGEGQTRPTVIPSQFSSLAPGLDRP